MNLGRSKIAIRFTPFWLGAFLVAFTVAAVAQSPKSSGKSATTTQPELTVTLRTLNWTICKGSKLKLELEVENIGRVPVEIVGANAWSQLSFTFRGISSEGPQPLRIGGGTGNRGEGRAGSFGFRELITIEPGTTETTSIDLELSDNFFYEFGTYTISTTLKYQGAIHQNYEIDSNEVEFQISNCGLIK